MHNLATIMFSLSSAIIVQSSLPSADGRHPVKGVVSRVSQSLLYASIYYKNTRQDATSFASYQASLVGGEQRLSSYIVRSAPLKHSSLNLIETTSTVPVPLSLY